MNVLVRSCKGMLGGDQCVDCRHSPRITKGPVDSRGHVVQH